MGFLLLSSTNLLDLRGGGGGSGGLASSCIAKLELVGYNRYEEITQRKRPLFSSVSLGGTSKLIEKILHSSAGTKCVAACKKTNNRPPNTQTELQRQFQTCSDVVFEFESYNTLMVAVDVIEKKIMHPIQSLKERLTARYQILPLQSCALHVHGILELLLNEGKSGLLSKCQEAFLSLKNLLQIILGSQKSLGDACKDTESQLENFRTSLRNMKETTPCSELSHEKTAIVGSGTSMITPSTYGNTHQMKEEDPRRVNTPATHSVNADSRPANNRGGSRAESSKSPDEGFFYTDNQLRCDLNPKEILSPLLGNAETILNNLQNGNSNNKLSGEISVLQGHLKEFLEEKTFPRDSDLDKLCKNNLRWISILTRFTALQLIINRQADLIGKKDMFAKFVFYLAMLPESYANKFVPLLQWAAKIGPEKIDGLFTSIFTFATRYFINKDSDGHERASNLKENMVAIPYGTPDDGSVDRAKCFVCMLQETNLDADYESFYWMNRYLVNKEKPWQTEPVSFSTCGC